MKKLYILKVVMFNSGEIYGLDFQKGILIVLSLFLTVALTERNKLIYIDYFLDIAKYRFTMRDFERLNNDPGACIFSSIGSIDLLMIVPKKLRCSH
jgi:hypothetical protein